MRSLEILLSLANLLTLFALVAGQARSAGWMRYTAFFALLIAAAQVLVEGPRWQLGPAYAMSGFLLLASLRQRRTPVCSAAGRSRLQRFLPGAAAASVALLCVCSVALPMLVPVFGFPSPSGPYGIGTVTHQLIDAKRLELFATNPNVARQLMMQIWYPTDVNASASRAAYIPDADAVTTAFARMHHLPTFIFGHMKYVTTNATVSAPAAHDQARFPVLLFLEGATGYRQMNTF